MKEVLFPLAKVITPNIPEAERLTGRKILNRNDMELAAKELGDKYRSAILLKGGHSIENASDVLYENGKITWFESARIDNPNTHGTGCTLSSSIACNLALGDNLEDAISKSKKYINKIINAKLDLGQGNGPLNHTA